MGWRWSAHSKSCACVIEAEHAEAEAAVNLDEGESLISMVQSEDLLKFGLIPEFVGRIPVVATLNELDEDALIQILGEPKNALIKQYQKLFEMDGLTLRFDEDALKKVVELTQEKEMGARGLRAVLETAMFEIMYELPSRTDVKECIITVDFIESKGPPIFVYKKKRA